MVRCVLSWEPFLICREHSLQSLTFERLGHCAVIVEEGIATVEEFPEKLFPDNDVVVELVEVISPEAEGAACVGGVGVAPWTKAASCKSRPRVWMLIIGVQEAVGGQALKAGSQDAERLTTFAQVYS